MANLKVSVLWRSAFFLVSYCCCKKLPQINCLLKLKKKNYHKHSDLKQCRFIILQFWNSGIQNESHWDKTKVQADCIPVSLTFPASSGLRAFHAPGPSSLHNLHRSSLCFHCHFSFSDCLPPPHLGTLEITLGSPG